MLGPLAALACLLAAPAAGVAADGAPRDLSLTVDVVGLVPFRFFTGGDSEVVELLGEWRLTDKLGVAGLLGGGAAWGPGYALPVFGVGAQALYYPVGRFDHGMQLGLEAHDGPLLAGVGPTGRPLTENDLLLAPVVGYKLATAPGFTLDLQGGVGWQLLLGGTAVTTGLGVDLRLNVGWTF